MLNKPNSANYILKTDEDKMKWNNDIEQYLKNKKIKISHLIPADNIYNYSNRRFHKLFTFY